MCDMMFCKPSRPAVWLMPAAGHNHHVGHGQCLGNGSASYLMGPNCDYCRDTVGFSQLLPIPWYSFPRSFSLQPMFAEKMGEKTMKKEKIWTKVILRKEKQTPEMAILQMFGEQQCFRAHMRLWLDNEGVRRGGHAGQNALTEALILESDSYKSTLVPP